MATISRSRIPAVGRLILLLATAAAASLILLLATTASLGHIYQPVAANFISFTRQQDPVARAKRLLLKADAVFFDVDSTVVTTEGIDLLGKCFGVEREIAELTQRAMDGHVRFQKAMTDRLQLMSENGMTQERLERCIRTEGIPQWSAGVQEVVKRLKTQGTDVYLVSGGFRNMIKPVAETLEIPEDHVFANTITFDEDGNYAGFDLRAPTARSGGKPAVLRMMQRANKYKVMLMIGDGATDLEARTQGPAKAFIGYGGVAERRITKEGADWFIHGFQELLDVLPAI